MRCPPYDCTKMSLKLEERGRLRTFLEAAFGPIEMTQDVTGYGGPAVRPNQPR